MDNKNPTPEERLLRIIRKAKKIAQPLGSEARKAQEKKAPLAQEKPPEPQLAAQAVEGPVEIDFLPPQLISSKDKKVNKLKLAEATLIVIFCLLTGYSLFDISNASSVKALDLRPAAKSTSVDYSEIEQAPGSLSGYSEVFNKKNLFIWRERSFVQDATASEDMAKALSSLSLMGVVEGATKQAIIFDRSTQKTFFLNPGDEVGPFVVDNIESGKVVLDFRGEKVELFL